jgi:DNA-directed RNA polymerase subunit RPC12/RpoP
MRTCSDCGDEFDPRRKTRGGLAVHCDDCSHEVMVSRPTESAYAGQMASHSTNPGKWGGERGEVKSTKL